MTLSKRYILQRYGRFDTPREAVSSACYGKQQVFVYLQPFSC